MALIFYSLVGFHLVLVLALRHLAHQPVSKRAGVYLALILTVSALSTAAGIVAAFRLRGVKHQTIVLGTAAGGAIMLPTYLYLAYRALRVEADRRNQDFFRETHRIEPGGRF